MTRQELTILIAKAIDGNAFAEFAIPQHRQHTYDWPATFERRRKVAMRKAEKVVEALRDNIR